MRKKPGRGFGARTGTLLKSKPPPELVSATTAAASGLEAGAIGGAAPPSVAPWATMAGCDGVAGSVTDCACTAPVQANRRARVPSEQAVSQRKRLPKKRP